MYSHLGAHAIADVDTSGSKIIIVTYECVEPSSDPLSWMAVYVTCSSVVGTVSSREPLTIKYKKHCDTLISITVMIKKQFTGIYNTKE